MNRGRLHTALVIGSSLALSITMAAKGSGGGHGSGGHGSGGHGSAGHAGGGHSGTGQSGGGHATGGSGQTGGRRTGGGSSGAPGGRSAPRDAGAGSGSGAMSSSPPAAAQGSNRRPDGGTVIGTAVPRSSVSSFTRLSPFGAALGVRYPTIGLGYGGLGLFYDPFWRGFGYSSFGYGYAYSPVSPFSTYGSAGYAADPFETIGPTGSIRLRVEPRNANVYVDGYYAGIVDDFDGHFQHLNLAPGPHHIEISAMGYQTIAVDVVIQPDHKIEYRHTLTRSEP